MCVVMRSLCVLAIAERSGSPPKIKMNMLSVISIFGIEKITTQKAIYSTHSIWFKFV